MGLVPGTFECGDERDDGLGNVLNDYGKGQVIGAINYASGRVVYALPNDQPRHFCDPEWAERPEFIRGYEAAALECVEADDRSLWVSNNEGGSSRVNFCPFCGYKAPAQITD